MSPRNRSPASARTSARIGSGGHRSRNYDPRAVRTQGPPVPNRYNGVEVRYPSHLVIQVPRPKSLILCPPFLRDFSRLGTHRSGIPREWTYYSRRSPFPFKRMLSSRERTTRDLFLSLRSDEQGRAWNRYVTGFDGMYSVPNRLHSGTYFIIDSSHAEYLLRLDSAM